MYEESHSFEKLDLPNPLNWSPVHYSVEKGDLRLTKLLLDNYHDVNAYDRYKRTPLTIAAAKGCLPLMKLLIDYGANVNEGDPLHFACEKGHVKAIEHLIKTGADINLERNRVTPIITACIKANLEVAELLLDYGADVTVVDQDESTPLHWACRSSNGDLIQLLMKRGCYVNAIDKSGSTPLCIALKNNDNKPELVKILLNDARLTKNDNVYHLTNNPAMIRLFVEHFFPLNVKNSTGQTAMYEKALDNKWECVETLLDCGACQNCPNNHGWIPLHIAALRGNLQATKLLISRNACRNQSTFEALTPLHLAAARGHLEVVQELVPHEHCSRQTITNNETPSLHDVVVRINDFESRLSHPKDMKKSWLTDSYTPKDLAALEDNMNVVEFLESHAVKFVQTPSHLNACRNLFTQIRTGHSPPLEFLETCCKSSIVDFTGRNALHHAVLNHNSHLIRLMMLAGFKVKLNDQDNFGYTPLSYAVLKENFSILKLLISYEADVKLGFAVHCAAKNNSTECLKELIKHGADVNGENPAKRTPILIAIADGNYDLLICLLENKANPNYITTDGKSALYHACCIEDTECVRILLEHGANPNLYCGNEPPLLRAAASGQTETLKLLLKYGASVDATDTYHQDTALKAACHSGHQACVEELIKAGASVNEKNSMEETPLHVAVENLNIVKMLIEAKAYVNASAYGWTPLHWCMEDRALQVAEELLENNAEVNAASPENVLPIYVAAVKGNADFVELLLNHGSYTDVPLLDIAEITNKSDTEELAEKLHIIPGNTPLIGAVVAGALPIVQMLIHHGSCVNSVNTYGNSALHEAVMRQDADVVKLLLAAEADFNLKNSKGETPVELAAKLDNGTIMKLFPEKQCLLNWDKFRSFLNPF